MKIDVIKFDGKDYPLAVVDLGIIFSGYPSDQVANKSLGNALTAKTENFNIDDNEAVDIDNQIYCYLPDFMFENNPSEFEVLVAILDLENIQICNITNEARKELLKLAERETKAMYAIKQLPFYFEVGPLTNLTYFNLSVCKGENKHVVYNGCSNADAIRIIYSALCAYRMGN